MKYLFAFSYNAFVLLYIYLVLNFSNVSIFGISPQGDLTPAEQRERRKLIRQRQQVAWEKEYTSTLQRERIWTCIDNTLVSDTYPPSIQKRGDNYAVDVSSGREDTLLSKDTSSSSLTPEKVEKVDELSSSRFLSSSMESIINNSPNCYWKGLQILLVEQSGLIACRDCPDVHNEGLYGMYEWKIEFTDTCR